MIRLAVLAFGVIGVAILVRVLRRPLPSSDWPWVEPDDEPWDDDGLWSRVAGRMAP